MTGETIEDEYFTRLHKLRNDSAQESRRTGVVQEKVVEVVQSGGSEGCESMHNDKRDNPPDANKGCEAI